MLLGVCELRLLLLICISFFIAQVAKLEILEKTSSNDLETYDLSGERIETCFQARRNGQCPLSYLCRSSLSVDQPLQVFFNEIKILQYIDSLFAVEKACVYFIISKFIFF